MCFILLSVVTLEVIGSGVQQENLISSFHHQNQSISQKFWLILTFFSNSTTINQNGENTNRGLKRFYFSESKVLQYFGIVRHYSKALETVKAKNSTLKDTLLPWYYRSATVWFYYLGHWLEVYGFMPTFSGLILYILANRAKFLELSSNCILIWSKIKLTTVVEGDLKSPFSIATTPRCRVGRYSFPWIAPLYPWYVPYNAEC